MEISDKMVEEFKELHRNRFKEELTDSEARESARNLLGLVKLLVDISAKDLRRKARFKKEPDGFPVDGQYSCMVCRTYIDPTSGWFTYYGPVCLLCNKAIRNGAVPVFVLQNRNSYFLTWQLKSTFGIHPATARKYLRENKLIAREVLNENGSVHEHIFLKKENPGLIERPSPERKSYDRHQRKVNRQMIKEFHAKKRLESAKTRK